MKNNGAWEATEAAYHQSSKALAEYLINRLPKDRPVFDFGCGTGYYVKKLKEAGFDAIGFDGYKANEEVVEIDLTQPLQLSRTGSVISLEVGEHIPKQWQEVYTRTVVNHCDSILIFSWAEIGQPGIGHVNCRDQKEVIADIERRGFVYLVDETKYVRGIVEDNVDWFRRTLLIFERKY